MKEYYANKNNHDELLVSEEISDLIYDEKKLESKLENIFVEFAFNDLKIIESIEKFSNSKKIKISFSIDNKNLHYFLNNKSLSCILYYNKNVILIVDNSKFSFSFKRKKDSSRSCLAKVTFL